MKELNAPLPPSLPKILTASLILTAGQPTTEDIAETIDRLFATGYHEDIQVDAKHAGDRVVLRLLTTPKWFIGHIRVTGKISSLTNGRQF